MWLNEARFGQEFHRNLDQVLKETFVRIVEQLANSGPTQLNFHKLTPFDLQLVPTVPLADYVQLFIDYNRLNLSLLFPALIYINRLS